MAKDYNPETATNLHLALALRSDLALAHATAGNFSKAVSLTKLLVSVGGYSGNDGDCADFIYNAGRKAEEGGDNNNAAELYLAAWQMSSAGAGTIPNLEELLPFSIKLIEESKTNSSRDDAKKNLSIALKIVNGIFGKMQRDNTVIDGGIINLAQRIAETARDLNMPDIAFSAAEDAFEFSEFAGEDSVKDKGQKAALDVLTHVATKMPEIIHYPQKDTYGREFIPDIDDFNSPRLAAEFIGEKCSPGPGGHYLALNALYRLAGKAAVYGADHEVANISKAMNQLCNADPMGVHVNPLQIKNAAALHKWVESRKHRTRSLEYKDSPFAVEWDDAVKDNRTHDARTRVINQSEQRLDQYAGILKISHEQRDQSSQKSDPPEPELPKQKKQQRKDRSSQRPLTNDSPTQ